MSGPTVALRGILGLCLAALYSALVGADPSADIKALADVTVSRLEAFPEVTMSISGLEFIPEASPAPQLGPIDQALGVFQEVLGQMLAHEPAGQVLNDVENLRSLLQRRASALGCALDTPSSQVDQGQLQALLADSAFSVVTATFNRLRGLLRFLIGHMDEVQSC
ncbi:PREDICTED: leptin [Gekko japonicus]|uniref:Leptin n=1 Tax=Gekko japonicus TaxID=146911 RepID=A0ABM1K484_GEKJA|nr:PREDICTED: leptin [Gekko japonicus]